MSVCAATESSRSGQSPPAARCIDARLTATMQQLAKLACAAFFAMLALLAGPSASKAQQPSPIPRLCFLTLEPGTLQTRSPRFDAFFQTLGELGYIDGQSIII